MGIFKLFFGAIWRTVTFIRNSLANLVFLLLIVAVVAALMPKEPQHMPDDIALLVQPSGILVDQYTYIPPLNRLLGDPQEMPAETRVDELVTAITRAATDPRINALVLELDDLIGGGLSKLEEIGRALETFKASGKPVYAVGSHFSQEQYYLAAHADSISLNPMGTVLLTGYSSYRNYFKDAFDKLALNFHVFRTGEYKDAVEPLIADHMSDASRENNSKWLGELWQIYTRKVEQLRDLEPGSINSFINSADKHLARHSGDGAAMALQLGLADELANNRRQVEQLRERLGEDNDGNYRALDSHSYLHYTDAEQNQQAGKVGVLIASGTIIDGYQPSGTIGSANMTDLIRSVAERDDINALVVRIDSGGGSAFASEVIREELQALRDQGLPVVVSMGSVAASGGYWMAMAADEVWATPSTITGSIGVFSAFPTLENSLDKLGIKTDGIGTTELAGALRVDRPLTRQASSLMQQSVDNIYMRFLDLVSEARGTTPEALHQIAQGRVWSGTTAQQLGLVDQLGDLSDAIAAAADKAGLGSNYSVTEVREPLSPGELIAEQLASDLPLGQHAWFNHDSNALLALPQSLRALTTPLLSLQALLQPNRDPRAVYAQCLDCLAP